MRTHSGNIIHLALSLNSLRIYNKLILLYFKTMAYSEKNIIENNNNEGVIDLLAVLSVIIKNFKMIIRITIIFMVGVLVFSIISIILPQDISYLPNEFSPKSLVMLNSSDSGGGLDSVLAASGMSSLAGIAGISSSGGAISDSQLAMKLVKTYSFIEKINLEFNLDEIYGTSESDYPETELRKAILERLVLSEDDETGLLTISYTDIDKHLATNIVNQITDLLEEEFDKIDNIRNRTQLSIIEDRKQKVEIELDKLQNEILTFQNTHNLVDVNVVFSELMKQIAELQSQLLMKNIAIDSFSQISSIKDPGYLKLVSERDALARAIELVEEGKTGDYPPLDKLPVLSLELEYLKRELDVQATVYKSIITQLESLKLTSDGTGPTFQILEKARIPEMKSGPSRGTLCFFVTFAGFFLSILFVFVRDAWINIKNDPEKMMRLKGLK